MSSSIQQAHPAPISTSRDSSVFPDMGSPASDKSFNPLETTETSSSAYSKAKTGHTKAKVQSTSDGATRRKSSESINSLNRRPTFNSYGSGRHSNAWLFGGISLRGTLRGFLEHSSKN